MKWVILFFLAIILGTIIFLSVLALFIYKKFKTSASSIGINYENFNELKEAIKQSDEESKTRVKSISGMSNILLPQIKRDYKNFNESEFYNKVETSLKGILNSISNEKLENIEELNLIENLINQTIDDNLNNGIKEKYSDIRFHKHAIKSYSNIGGSLTITVASSLEYYYEKSVKGKIKQQFDNYKKQTSFTTKFVHIYDPEKYVPGKNYLAAHCPNCNAPLKNFKDDYCEFCGSGVDAINLKSWFISEYKEDKR